VGTVGALALGVAVVLLITVATGYFVAQEFAYMAVDRSRLKSRAESGDLAATRALAVTRRTSFMLSGAQLGITVTGLLVGYAAEPLIGQSLGTLLGGVGIPTAVSVVIGAVLALLFSTLVQMLFGELFPKNLAIARAEPVALRLAWSTTLYLTLMGWLIWFFDQASNLVLRALRIEPVHDLEHAASARDLEHIVADSRDSGDLPAELSVMIDRILDFPSRDVEHAMIPRAHVDTVSATDTIGEVRARMGQGHSRYPIVAEDPEAIVGVVHLADLLRTEHADEALVTAIARPALVVPTLMALPDALAQLNATENQLACVVDEYGGFAGVLTLEDLAEEIVGEITDEHDPETQQPPEPDDGVWVMAGSIHVDEVERALGVDLPRGDYETIAGLTISQHGSLPERGTTVVVPLPPDPADLVHEDGPRPTVLLVEVLEVAQYVPATVRLTLAAAGDPADDPAPGDDGGSA
jgi:CBS domain containing-hemolysin-like protein